MEAGARNCPCGTGKGQGPGVKANDQQAWLVAQSPGDIPGIRLCLVAGPPPGDNAGYAGWGQAGWQLVSPGADWLNPFAGIAIAAVSGLSGICIRLAFRWHGARANLKLPPPRSVRMPGPEIRHWLRLRT